MPFERCQNQKYREKFLLVYGITMTIFSLILLIMVLKISIEKIQEIKGNKKLCLTKECVSTASTLISSMNFSVDPCDDFYKFTCSNFIHKNPVPIHKLSISNFLQYQDVLTLQQINLIENYNSRGKANVMLRAQEAYHVCINTSYNEEKELEALKEFIESVFDGWPIYVGPIWKPKNNTIEEYFGEILRYDFDVEFIKVSPYSENLNKSNPFVFQVDFHTLKSVFLPSLIFHSLDGNNNETSEMSLYVSKFFFRTLSSFGSYDNSTVLKDLQDIEKLHLEIENITAPYDDLKDDPKPEKMTIKQLNELTEKKFDWLKMLNTVVRGIFSFQEDDSIYVSEPELIKHIPDLLNRYSRRTITNSIVLEAFRNEVMIEASYTLKKILNEFSREYNHYLKPKTNTEEKCLDWVKTNFPIVLTRMFVEEFVNKDNIEAADELIQLLEKSYKRQIENSEWLDEETKNEALKKGDAIKRFVGYPDFTLDDEGLEKAYAHLPVVESTYFKNYIDMLLNVTNYNLFEYINSTTKNVYSWPRNPLAINALYTPLTNAIWFPAGVLQLPFFDVNRLAAVNFGIIGSIVGHELGHAFDSTGRHYDEDGDEREWWTNETATIFLKKSDCFIEQYDNYTIEDITYVNGEITLGENLADNTGLEASYNAYKEWVKENGEEPSLPGLEKFTLEQIFFISFGHIWCENITPENAKGIADIDIHSPGRYRVIGVLSNNKNFREAFKCKEGLMNRGDKSCTVW